MERRFGKKSIFILKGRDLFSQAMFYFERFTFVLKVWVFFLKGRDLFVLRIILPIAISFFLDWGFLTDQDYNFPGWHTFWSGIHFSRLILFLSAEIFGQGEISVFSLLEMKS